MRSGRQGSGRTRRNESFGSRHQGVIALGLMSVDFRQGTARIVPAMHGVVENDPARYDETQVNPCVTVRVIRSRLMSLNFWNGAESLGDAGCGQARCVLERSGAVRHDETGFNRPVTKELTGLCLMSQGLWR